MSLSNALAFFLPLFILHPPAVESSSRDNSAVSFTVCDDFTWSAARDDRFSIEVRSKSTPDKVYKASFVPGGIQSKALQGKIKQQDVQFVKYLGRKEMCFQSLVVDTTIIIDQPTFLERSCAGHNKGLYMCKKWDSELLPVPVCPEVVTKLLHQKNQLIALPSKSSGATDFQAPVYDITNDMAQASLAIAEGTSELFRKVVKHKWKALERAKSFRFSDLGRKLESFNSFIGAFGPMFSIFSGITSIVTTFVTPNPFDELANYLKKEFSAINRRLSHIQGDIEDVKRVVENQGGMAGMVGKLQAIRYSLRAYDTMVKKLTEDKVCGANKLFNWTEIRHFMKQYESARVDDSLLDLFGVEFGDVLESPSLLTALMRAYCNANTGKVQHFIDGVIYYAAAGNLAHRAYQSLEYRMEGRQDCNEDEKEDNIWNRNLYRFLKKAEALKTAITDPGYGLQLDIQDNVDKLIYDKLAANSNQYNELFDEVFKFIMNKLTDVNDWPETCMYNLHDKVVIIEVAELDNAATYDRNIRPWFVELDGTVTNKLRKFKYHVKQADDGLYTKQNLPDDVQFNCPIPTQCKVSFRNRPDSHDWIISFLYSPNSYLNKAHRQNIDHVTPSVFVKRRPLYVYYTNKTFIKERIAANQNMHLAIAGAYFGPRDKTLGISAIGLTQKEKFKHNAAFIDGTFFCESRKDYEPLT